jgi:hypothetical protein
MLSSTIQDGERLGGAVDGHALRSVHGLQPDPDGMRIAGDRGTKAADIAAPRLLGRDLPRQQRVRWPSHVAWYKGCSCTLNKAALQRAIASASRPAARARRRAADLGPFFKGLPDDRCQCPHWGYVIKGKLVYHYPSGDDVITTGEGYFAKPGHLPEIFAGTEVVEFSPTAELAKTLEVVTKNMEAMG